MNSESIEKSRNDQEAQGDAKKDDAPLLWEEYKYRHELCWKFVFQMTTAVVVLSVIPYVHVDVVRALQQRILAIPLLALALILFAIPVIVNELILLGRIKQKYRYLQERFFGIVHKKTLFKREIKVSVFFSLIMFYFACLFVFGIFNLCYVSHHWVPYVMSLPQEHIKPDGK